MLGVASIALSLTVENVAFGATDDAGGGLALEEIMVTARKREERVQDIPQAIKAFSAQDLENAGITRVIDLVANVPNMILQPSYRQGVVNLSARGHSTPQQGDSPIVLNVDGVQEPAQDFINQDLFDIERIEVLKGPQGALYGAGAIAGAINIVTKKPSNNFEGFAKAKIGNSNERRYVAGISGPIVNDTLLFRLSGVSERNDGYIRNTLTNNLVDFVKDETIRGTIYGNFDGVRLDVRATYTHANDGASYYEALTLLPDTAHPEIDNLFGGPLGRLGSDTSKGTHLNHSGVETQENRKIFTASAKIEFDLAGGVLTSVTGYNNSKQKDYGDLDFQPFNLLLQDVRFDAKVFNEELRFTSDSSQKFRWVAGVFYQHRKIYNQVEVLLGDFTTRSQTIQEAQNTYSGTLTDGRDNVSSNAYAGFLNLNYDLTDQLTLTAAARYDSVKIDTEYVGQTPSFLTLPNQNASETFNKFQPKVNLAYKITPDVLAYVDLARGFRSGAPNPTAAFAGGLPRFLKPEVSDTVEVGVKSRLLDGRMILNADAFYNRIKNRQHYFYGASLQSMTNYDKAKVYGVEADMAAVLAAGLKLTASAGLMSAKIDSDEISNYYNFTTHAVALTINNNGNTLPDTPTSTFNAALDYETAVTSNVNVFGRIAYRYASKIYFDTENFINDGGSKSFVDMRFGFRGDAWDITGYVNNLTDKRTYTNYAYSGGAGNYLPNKPRTYGVEMGYHF
jgi:iron complex outermembrane receptor protein